MNKSNNSPLKYLLSDLDGVIRQFPNVRNEEIEKRCGLSSGALLQAAFDESHLTRVITGVISHNDWQAEIIELLSKTYTQSVATQAVKDWSSFPGKVDFRYLKFLEVNFANVPVAVLTNGTSRLHQDLKILGITDRFYQVFNSSEIGYCKPDPKVFEHVIEALNCNPDKVFFIDDSLSHVLAARQLGMATYHYRSFEEFQKDMSERAHHNE